MGGFFTPPDYGILMQPQLGQMNFGYRPQGGPRSLDNSIWNPLDFYQTPEIQRSPIDDYRNKVRNRGDFFEQLALQFAGDEQDKEYKRKLQKIITQSPMEYAQDTQDDYLSRGGGKWGTILREALVAIAKGPEYVPIMDQLRANAQKDYLIQTQRLQHANDMNRVNQEVLPRLYSAMNQQALMEERLQSNYAKLKEKEENDYNRNTMAKAANEYKKGKLELEQVIGLQNMLNKNRNIPLDMQDKELAVHLSGGYYDDELQDWTGYDPELYAKIRMARMPGQGRGDTERTTKSLVPKVVREGDEDKIKWLESRSSTSYKNKDSKQALRDSILNYNRGNVSQSPLNQSIDQMQLGPQEAPPPQAPTIYNRITSKPNTTPPQPTRRQSPSVITPENIDSTDVRGATNYNKESTETKDMIGKLQSATGLAMEEYSKYIKANKDPNIGIGRYTGGLNMNRGGNIMNRILSGGQEWQQTARKNLGQYTGVGRSPEEAGLDQLLDDTVATNIFGRGGKTLTPNEMAFFEKTRPRKGQDADQFLTNSIIYTFGTALIKFKERHGLTRDSKYDETGLQSAVVANAQKILDALNKGIDPKAISINSIADSFYAKYFGVGGEDRDKPEAEVNSGVTKKGRKFTKVVK